MPCKVLFIFVVLLLAYIYINAQQNPFLPPSKTVSTNDTLAKSHERIQRNTFTKKIPFLKPLIHYQKNLSQFLTSLLRKINEDFSVTHLLILFAIAFFYGIVHALGPGHAKLIIGSYMLSNKHKVRHSFLAGSIFAATHVGMALLIFSIFNLVLHISHADTNSISTALYNISGIMIVIIGIALLVHVFIKEENNSGKLTRFLQKSSLPAISVISGLMPCPGALLILVFSKIIGITFYGIVSVVFLSLGMALTVSIAGSVGVLANRAVLLSAHGNTLKIIVKTVRIFSVVIIITIGLLMILY